MWNESKGFLYDKNTYVLELNYINEARENLNKQKNI